MKPYLTQTLSAAAFEKLLQRPGTRSKGDMGGWSYYELGRAGGYFRARSASGGYQLEFFAGKCPC